MDVSAKVQLDLVEENEALQAKLEKAREALRLIQVAEIPEYDDDLEIDVFVSMGIEDAQDIASGALRELDE